MSVSRFATIRRGFWASIVILISGIGLLLGIVASSLFLPAALTTTWQGIEPYAEAYRATGGVITSLSFLAALVACPAYLLQVASILRLDQRAWGTRSRFGFTAATMFVVLAGLNYIIQLTVVRVAILSGEAKEIEWLVFQNPASITLVLDFLGWFFLGLALLSVVPLFKKGMLHSAIRYLLIANAFVSTITLGSLLILDPMIGQVLLSVMSGLLTCVDILFIVFFRRLLLAPTAALESSS